MKNEPATWEKGIFRFVASSFLPQIYSKNLNPQIIWAKKI